MKKLTAAKLSLESYSPPGFDRFGQPLRIETADGEFVVSQHTSTRSGYQGTLFRNIQTGNYVLAHRGTEFDREALKDGLVDLGMVTTKANAQRADALAFTRTAMEIAKQEKRSLHVTGHSLGGTLGQ